MTDLISGDLRDEEYREYVMGDTVYRISDPVTLYFRNSGSTHRVLDAKGIVHCVPGPGYRNAALRWKPRDPTKPVSF